MKKVNQTCMHFRVSCIEWLLSVAFSKCVWWSKVAWRGEGGRERERARENVAWWINNGWTGVHSRTKVSIDDVVRWEEERESVEGDRMSSPYPPLSHRNMKDGLGYGRSG